jgi:hypothetical protein
MSRRLAAAVAIALVSVGVGLGVRPLPDVSAEDECVVLESFATAKVGVFPTDWKARKDEGTAVYVVKEEGGHRFLAARSKGLGIQAAKQHEWDLTKYPVLAWRWRAVEFPRGADERESATNDSAAAVYVLVPHSKVRGPKAVKYIWSEKVPGGTRLNSNMGLTQVRVLRSGTDKKDAWVEERVNAREDYLKFFDTKDTPTPAGIAVLTDADDTQSTAAGDYADFRVCRK